MEILEFGDRTKRKIILIHGFQCPYQIWNRYIEHYRKDFHIIVPILPGHNVEKQDEFLSFSETARELEEYYLSQFGENVYALFGISMGGVLVAHIWQNKRLKVEKIIFDGSPLMSYNGFMKKMLVNFYLNITHKTQKRDAKTVKQAVNSIISEENLEDFLKVLDGMSDETIINCITGVGDYKLPSDIDTPDTKLYFYHGTKGNEMFAQKTAKYMKQNYPTTTVKCFKGKGHCENTLIYPEIMIKELDGILR